MSKVYKKIPYAYFITFTTYGSWLPGDERLSVDKLFNKISDQKRSENLYLKKQSSNYLKVKSLVLNETERYIVLNAIKDCCNRYDWRLFAAHTRSNHVHIILSALASPERVMSQLKAYATRYLRQQNIQKDYQKVWTRHGSTRYIWSIDKLYPVMRYVVDEQGAPMACFCEPWYDSCLY